MKHKSIFIPAIALAALFALASCEWKDEKYKFVEPELRGTWKRDEPVANGKYKGIQESLVLGSNSFRITEPAPGFTELTHADFAYSAYTEDGKLYIKDGSGEKSYPYTITTGAPPAYGKLLAIEGGKYIRQ